MAVAGASTSGRCNRVRASSYLDEILFSVGSPAVSRDSFPVLRVPVPSPENHRWLRIARRRRATRRQRRMTGNDRGACERDQQRHRENEGEKERAKCSFNYARYGASVACVLHLRLALINNTINTRHDHRLIPFESESPPSRVYLKLSGNLREIRSPRLTCT